MYPLVLLIFFIAILIALDFILFSWCCHLLMFLSIINKVLLNLNLFEFALLCPQILGFNILYMFIELFLLHELSKMTTIIQLFTSGSD